MEKKITLVSGTSLEIVAGGIVTAGLYEVDKGNADVGLMLVIIGVAMFFIGFIIVQWRGSVKKNKKAGEDLRVQLDIENILDMIPDELKDKIKPHVNDILVGVGTNIEKLTEPGNLK